MFFFVLRKILNVGTYFFYVLNILFKYTHKALSTANPSATCSKAAVWNASIQALQETLTWLPTHQKTKYNDTIVFKSLRLSGFNIQPFATNHIAFLAKCWLLDVTPQPFLLTPKSIHTVTRSALCALCAPDTVKECIWVLPATGGLLHTQECNALASTSLCSIHLALKLAELKLFLHSKTENEYVCKKQCRDIWENSFRPCC